MCKEEMNEELLDEEVECEEEGLESLSREELIEVVYNLMEKKEKEIGVSNELVLDNKINNNNFKDGCDIASRYLGIYSTLLSGGLSEQDAFEITINQQNIDFNKELNTQNCDTSIATCKLQDLKNEQSQI